ncbi:MAG: hypothetical protein IID44_22825 [Planctomycetes bacterium]|nr:hypothetical protein [Planctomycetota bacterium]
MAMVEQSMLGVGIYSPGEAARYMRADKNRFRRWIYGRKNSAPVFDPEIPRVDTQELVTFLDFAQALSIQDIRLNIGVPLQRIRQAYEAARHDYGLDYPFAVKHGIFVFGDLSVPKNCHLGVYPEGESQDPDSLGSRCVQLTGKNKDNLLIFQIVQKFSKRLAFSTKGLADEYLAFEKHGYRILMQPDCRFGKPYIEGLVYEAETLSEAAKNEGGVTRASDLYEVPKNAVKAAIAYMQELDTPPPSIQPKKISV